MPQDPASGQRKVFCYGDCLTAGTSGLYFYPYAPYMEHELLKREENKKIVTVQYRGMPGWTSKEMLNVKNPLGTALRTMLERSLPEPPSLVVLMGGTNDITQYVENNEEGAPFVGEIVTKQLVELHGICHELGVAKTIAIGIPPSGLQANNPAAAHLRESINSNLEHFAKNSNGRTVYVPFPFEYIPNGPNWQADQLHLSKPGYQALGEAMAPFVNQVLRSLNEPEHEEGEEDEEPHEEKKFSEDADAPMTATPAPVGEAPLDPVAPFVDQVFLSLNEPKDEEEPHEEKKIFEDAVAPMTATPAPAGEAPLDPVGQKAYDDHKERVTEVSEPIAALPVDPPHQEEEDIVSVDGENQFEEVVSPEEQTPQKQEIVSPDGKEKEAVEENASVDKPVVVPDLPVGNQPGKQEIVSPEGEKKKSAQENASAVKPVVVPDLPVGDQPGNQEVVPPEPTLRTLEEPEEEELPVCFRLPFIGGFFQNCLTSPRDDDEP